MRIERLCTTGGAAQEGSWGGPPAAFIEAGAEVGGAHLCRSQVLEPAHARIMLLLDVLW